MNTAGGVGVLGTSDGVAVWGTSGHSEGVHAETRSRSTAAMAAYQLDPDSDTAAFFAKHAGGRTAGVFVGNVVITGDLELANADCAEEFEVGAGCSTEPGSVMVLDDEGRLRTCTTSYDRRVTGVISGAGDYRPGLVLDKQESNGNRVPIALIGKVFCKVDAHFGQIGVGDLLTTCPTPGHAMRIDDPGKAIGAVIGKALRPFVTGRGLIPILVTLQ